MSNMNRNSYQHGGHSGGRDGRSTGHRNFDHKRRFKKKDWHKNKEKEEAKNELSFYFKEPNEKKEFKIGLGGNNTKKVEILSYSNITTEMKPYSFWLKTSTYLSKTEIF